MQHTSSIFDSDAFHTSRYGNSASSTQRLLETGNSFRRREPGFGFEYTNLGYSVLAAVCEKITGMKFDTLAREYLFTPLGIDAAYVPANLHNTRNIAAIYNERHSMTRSVQSQLDITHSPELGFDNHLAQGNLTISAIDYARVLAMLRGADTFNLLSEESVRAIHNTNIRGVGYDQGLATRLSNVPFVGSNAFWHTGSSYGTFAQYTYTNDGTNRGVVVITTGATTSRTNGMVNVCTDLSAAVWGVLGF